MPKRAGMRLPRGAGEKNGTLQILHTSLADYPQERIEANSLILNPNLAITQAEIDAFRELALYLH
jgi:hypothetical protein